MGGVPRVIGYYAPTLALDTERWHPLALEGPQEDEPSIRHERAIDEHQAGHDDERPSADAGERLEYCSGIGARKEVTDERGRKSQPQERGRA